MWAQDAEPAGVSRRPAGGIARGAARFGHRRSRGAGAKVGHGCLEVRVGNPIKALARGGVGRYGCEALIQIAAVLPQMQGDHRLDPGPLLGVEVAQRDEMLAQGAGLVARPGLDGGNEPRLVDQPVLQRQESEEEITVGISHVPDPAQSRERIGALSHRPVA